MTSFHMSFYTNLIPGCLLSRFHDTITTGTNNHFVNSARNSSIKTPLATSAFHINDHQSCVVL